METYRFKTMSNVVHIDEKWFWMEKTKINIYKLASEGQTYRHIKNKTHIVKVMFLSAVSRPSYDTHRHEYFNGKIGIWPFIETKVAKKNSKYRRRGDVYIVPQTSVDKNLQNKCYWTD